MASNNQNRFNFVTPQIYAETNSRHIELNNKLLSEFKSAFDEPNQLIVDFGCGTGETTHQMANGNNKKVIGLDLSPDMVEYCKQHYQLDFRTFDVSNENCKMPLSWNCKTRWTSSLPSP